MKKLFYSLMLLATVMAGCSKEMPQNDLISVEPSLDHPGYNKVSIYADVAGDDTKTSYAGDVTFSWTAGDKISVLYHDGENNPHWVEFAAQSSAAKSRFDGLVPDGYTMGAPTTGTWWALYPANDNHVYTSDSDIKFYLPNTGDGSTARIPMIGKLVSGETYRFRQLCGAIKLDISNIRSGVSNIKVEINTHGWSDASNTYKLVSGAFPIVGPASDAPSISATQASSFTGGSFVTSATAPVSTQSAIVYIPIPNEEYWATVEFNITDADRDILLYSKSFGSGQILFVERQKISRLSSLVLDDVGMIQEDGYFDDWGRATGVASKSWSGNQPFDFKVVSDGTNIWFYHKVYGNKVQLDYSGYIELFVDTDGDSATGDISDGKWYARGVDKDLVYYYSKSTGVPRESFSFVRWENYNSGTSSWTTGGDSPSVNWAAYQDPVSKDMTFEWGTTLAAMGLTAGNTVRFGFVLRAPELTSNNNLLSYTIPTP